MRAHFGLPSVISGQLKHFTSSPFLLFSFLHAYIQMDLLYRLSECVSFSFDGSELFWIIYFSVPKSFSFELKSLMLMPHLVIHSHVSTITFEESLSVAIICHFFDF